MSEKFWALIDCLQYRFWYSRLIDSDIAGTEQYLWHSESFICYFDKLGTWVYFSVGLPHETPFNLFVIREHKLLLAIICLSHLFCEIRTDEWALLLDLLDDVLFTLQINFFET
jgi:hypothetical protein